LIRPLFIIWNRLKPFEQVAVCTESVFWTLNRLVPSKLHYGEKCWNVFIKNLNFWRKIDMDILDDMGVSKLSAKVVKSELLL